MAGWMLFRCRCGEIIPPPVVNQVNPTCAQVACGIIIGTIACAICKVVLTATGPADPVRHCAPCGFCHPTTWKARECAQCGVHYIAGGHNIL